MRYNHRGDEEYFVTELYVLFSVELTIIRLQARIPRQRYALLPHPRQRTAGDSLMT